MTPAQKERYARHIRLPQIGAVPGTDDRLQSPTTEPFHGNPGKPLPLPVIENFDDGRVRDGSEMLDLRHKGASRSRIVRQ